MRMIWKRTPPILALVVGLAMIAGACGGTETVIETVVVTSIVTETETVTEVVTETETVIETVVVTSIVTETETVTEVVTETVEVMVEEDRTLRVAIPDDVESLDLARGQSNLTNLVLKNVYMQPVQYLPGPSQGRFSYADTTAFEGQWLEAWDFSDDARTLTLKLRQGLEFPTTGNKVTSDDVVYSIERGFGIPFAGTAWVWGNIGVTSIDQVERVDEQTLILHDIRPSTIVLPLMRDQTMGVLDSAAVKANATDEDPWAENWLGANYAGNGRYVVDRWDRGARMVLKANPTWPGRQPFFETVELIVVPESANRLALLQNGEVDIALNLSTQEEELAAASDGVSVLSIPDRNTMNVMLNTEQPPFDNVDLRKALAYAVDYDAIVNGVFNGQAVTAEGPISVNSRFFDLFGLGEGWMYEYNPDKAREHLAAAGYPDGFAFKLITRQGISVDDAVAVNLKANFADIGVDMEQDPVSGSKMAEHLGQRTYQAAFRGGLLDYIDDPFYHFYLWWVTNTVINWTGYSNARVDQIIEETAPLLGDDARRGPYAEAVGLVVDASPMLWLANANFTLAVSDDIGGYVHHPDGLMWFAALERTK
jgi:peptide/nickel transport system substrate-binding protein